MDEFANQECCTVQHLAAGRPSNEWTPEQLAAYAQVQHGAIIEGEQHLAVRYWRLGVAIELLRRNFTHGQWELVLARLQIEKTRASRARAIARTFSEEEQLAGLTLKEAYERRVRQRASTAAARSTKERSGVLRLERFLAQVAATAESLIDDAGFAEAKEAAALLSVVDAALAKLEQVRELLRKQADSMAP
ncbi:MAG: hypothetical protein KY475_08325 [Planctomycetes bacterium]|nr:hypothetical protein [Planctomycetota bacterium]